MPPPSPSRRRGLTPTSGGDQGNHRRASTADQRKPARGFSGDQWRSMRRFGGHFSSRGSAPPSPSPGCGPTSASDGNRRGVSAGADGRWRGVSGGAGGRWRGVSAVVPGRGVGCRRRRPPLVFRWRPVRAAAVSVRPPFSQAVRHVGWTVVGLLGRGRRASVSERIVTRNSARRTGPCLRGRPPRP